MEEEMQNFKESYSLFPLEFLRPYDFIEFINKERKKQGIYNRDIAKFIGLGENQVSKITAGTRGVTVDNLIKILRCLGYRLALTKIEYPDSEDWFPDDDELDEMNDVSDFHDLTH